MTACLVCASGIVSVAAGDLVKSRWRTDEMKVDGAIAEFSELTSVASGVAVTAANDADVLQLVLAMSDPSVRQRVMVAGLIVYVDPTNKNKPTFGIRVPPLSRRSTPDAPPDEPKLTYVEVIGPGKDERHIVELSDATGIEAMTGSHEGSLVLEFLIPLRTRDGWPYAPGVAVNQRVVRIGLETPDPPSMPGREGGRGRRGGGRGGMSGGGGRGGGMPRGGMSPDDAPEARGGMTGKPLKIWTSMELATAR